MKIPKFTLAITFLASAIWVQATTLTLTGSLSNFQADSSDPNEYAGLGSIATGNPYSLKLVFDDTPFSIPGVGSGTTRTGALQTFELSVNGILRVVMNNLDVQFYNNLSGRDSIFVQSTGAMTVYGMSPSATYGSLSMQVYDSSQSALQVGQSPNFGAFFDNAADAFSMGINRQVIDPYTPSHSILNFSITDDPLLVIPSVPDTGASIALLVSGLLALGVVKRWSRI